MFFPESLYQLSARDLQVSWLDPVFFREESSVAAVSHEITYTVPQGRALLLQNLVADAAAGAAQTCSDMQTMARPPTTNQQFYIAVNWYNGGGGFPVSAAAPQQRAVNWAGQLLVPELWRVSIQANFSAAANPNFCHLSVIGLLIPIANVQRV